MVQQKNLADEILTASCGIGAWHVGQPPDPRIREAAFRRGVTLNSRAKLFTSNFLSEFDYIMAADPEVLQHLLTFANTPALKAKLHLMTSFGKTFKGAPVIDPFYKEQGGFEHILDVLEDACEGLLEEILRKQNLAKKSKE